MTRALALAAALACGAAAATRPAGAKPPAYLKAVEVVDVVGGELRAAGRPVKAGYVLSPDVKLELASGARAVLRVGSAGAVQLTGPAGFRLSAGSKPGFSLDQGRFLAALPRLDGPFHVRAHAMVAAVRGTDFFLNARGTQELYFCACHGTVEMSEDRPRGYRKTVKGEHHSARLYRMSKGVTVESDAGLEDHSDAELDALHALK